MLWQLERGYARRKHWEARLIAVELAGLFAGGRSHRDLGRRGDLPVPGHVLVERVMGAKF